MRCFFFILMAVFFGSFCSDLTAADTDVVARHKRRPLDPSRSIIGTLESDPARADLMQDTASPGVVVGITWDQCEHREGEYDSVYLKNIKAKLDAFKAAGKFIVIDLGVQYPPRWIFSSPTSRFVNQDGTSFEPAPGAGDCGVNLVFSQEMRMKFDDYLSHLFNAVGSDIDAVRLGGGRYGELGYPINRYKDQPNSYWAFDPVAQGKVPGLPPGMESCPVAGWIPGAASPNHESARRFLDWYMACMENYHDWQIADVRKYFSGPFFMLYPSTGGLRPGQLEAAINDDANGSTGPEKTGEVGRGYDMARYVAGIQDPQVVVYSTWIDGFDGSDDASLDLRRWNPAHFLGSLAAAHHPPLLVGGENTGHPDTLANMQVAFQRIQEDHLCVMFWAFEHTLFDNKNDHATFADFKKISAEGRPLSP